MAKNHKNKNDLVRLKWDYTKKVKIPKSYKQFLWDYPDGTAPLEMMILRILTYGTFQDLEWLYKKYSEETNKLAFKYPVIKRGVRFWVRKWHDAHV